jgi:predicted ester cyclase
MLGLPRTGRSVALTDFHVYRFQNGKVAELWAFRNRLAFAVQLGLIGGATPAPKSAAVQTP